MATPLRARLDGFPDLTIGLLGSAYFAGHAGWDAAAPAIIRRGGHIRAFAAFVALAVVAVVLMPIFVSPGAWLVCRALIGFVFAGIYAVIEAWINAKATNANRGALYARLPDRQFRRLRDAASWRCSRSVPPAFRPSRSPAALARAGDRADGDDQRRSARAAARGQPAPSLARRALAPVSVRRGARRRGRQRRLDLARRRSSLQIGMSPDDRAAFHRGDRDRLGARRLSRRRLSDRIDRRLVMAVVMIGGRGARSRAEPS